MLKTVKNGCGIRVDPPPVFFKIPTFSRFFFGGASLIQVAPPGGQIFKYCKCIVDQICQDEYGLTDSHSLIGSFWRTSVATAPLEIFCRKGRYCLNIGKLPQEIKGGRQVFIWRILQSSYLMRVHCAPKRQFGIVQTFSDADRVKVVDWKHKLDNPLDMCYKIPKAHQGGWYKATIFS